MFSNGILLLAGASIALLLATGAKVAALIPMYAIGVFTGFTMAGAGMVDPPLAPPGPALAQERGRQRHRRRGLRRRRGRLRHRRVHPGRLGGRRRDAAHRLRPGADQPRVPGGGRRPGGGRGRRRPARPRSSAATSSSSSSTDRPGHGPGHPVRPHASRPTTCGPSTSTSTTSGPSCSSSAGSSWASPGCPSTSSTARTAAWAGPPWSWPPSWPTARPRSACCCPRRSYGKAWRRILHDQTADRIVEIVSQLPHVNATIIPFHVAPGLEETTLVVEPMLDAATPARGRASAPDRARRRLGLTVPRPARPRSPSCSGGPGPGSPAG